VDVVVAKDLSVILKPVIEKMGYIHWGLQFRSHGRRVVLRVYIDHPEGITLDDCSAVSNQLSGVLDVEDVLRQPYTLEVSSPGVERLLLNNEHYESYIGAKLKVKTYVLLNDRKNFTGRLEAASEHTITLKMEDGLIDIPFTAIKQAQLVCENWQPSKMEKNYGK